MKTTHTHILLPETAIDGNDEIRGAYLYRIRNLAGIIEYHDTTTGEWIAPSSDEVEAGLLLDAAGAELVERYARAAADDVLTDALRVLRDN